MDRKMIILIIKIVVWIGGLYLSTIYQLHTLYFIFSGFYFIFTNLGKRQKGTLSAYSVFNDNFQRLAGTMDGNSIFKGQPQQLKPILFQKKKSTQNNESNQNIKIDYFKNESKYGNKPCYCGSQIKFKKCCLPAQRKRLQEQRIKRIKAI